MGLYASQGDIARNVVGMISGGVVGQISSKVSLLGGVGVNG